VQTGRLWPTHHRWKRDFFRSSERANAQSEILKKKEEEKKPFSFRPFNSLQFVADQVSCGLVLFSE